MFLCDNSTSTAVMLRKLHWLPIRVRITHESTVFLYGIYYQLPVPSYLSNAFFSERKFLQYNFRQTRDLKLYVKSTNNHFGVEVASALMELRYGTLPEDLRRSASRDIFKSSENIPLQSMNSLSLEKATTSISMLSLRKFSLIESTITHKLLRISENKN